MPVISCDLVISFLRSVGGLCAARPHSHNQAFTPSGAGVVHQIELAMSVIGRMGADIQQVEVPSTRLCRLVAPCSKITLLLMVIARATLVGRRGLCAAPALVDGVMIFHLLAVADFFA